MSTIRARQLATVEEHLFCDCGGSMNFNGAESVTTFVHVCDRCQMIEYVVGNKYPRQITVPAGDWVNVPAK
jgi:hypothetical protein